jgi:uncharacterized phage-associated protein
MKLINKELTKRINAILYFCDTVRYPHKTKIYKLLYFLDFIHFKQVGRPVTDQEYYTFSFGPAPIPLHNELKDENIPEDLKPYFEIIKKKDELTGEDRCIEFIPRKRPRLDVFSARERQIALIFKEAKAEEMVEITHLQNAPWDITVKNKGMGQKIDFFLALDRKALIDLDSAKERYGHLKEIKSLFG